MDNKKIYFSCDTGCIDKGKLYTVDCKLHDLYEIDLPHNSYKLVSEKLAYELSKETVYGICKDNNLIVFLVSRDRPIVIAYDIVTDRIDRIIAAYDAVNSSPLYGFTKKDSIIYFYHVGLYEEVYMFDMTSKSFLPAIRIDPTDYDKKIRNYDSYGRKFFTNEGIFLFPYRTNRVLCWNEYGKWKKAYTLPDDIEFEYTVLYNNEFYMTSKTDCMLRRWMPDTGDISECEIIGLTRKTDQRWDINNIIVNGKMVLCTSEKGRKIHILNMESGESKCLDSSDFCELTYPNGWYFKDGVAWEERILLLPKDADSFLLIDLNECVSIKQCLDNKEVIDAEWRMKLVRGEKIMEREKDEFSINDYIRFLGKSNACN